MATTTETAQTPETADGRPAATLAMFLGTLARETFFSEYWGQKFCQCTSQELLERRPFALRDLVALVAFLRPRDGRIRLIQDGAQVWKGGLEADGVYNHVTEALTQGMTVVLERLDLYWPPIVELCGDLALALGCPVHANAYLTPGGAGGLNPHYDTHDVFVLQLEGEKHWTLGEIVTPLPTEQTASGRVSEMGPSTQRTIRPGGVFYLPRGMAHSARSAAGHSLHLTIGCIPNTYGDELLRLVRSAAHTTAALRRSLLPTTTQQPGPNQQTALSSLLGELAQQVEQGTLLPQRKTPTQASGCYRLDDAATQCRVALDIAGISGASRFQLTQPEGIELMRDPGQDDDAVIVRGGGREARISAALLPAVRTILAMSEEFTLAELAADVAANGAANGGAEVDAASAVRAVVRLVSASFLRVVG